MTKSTNRLKKKKAIRKPHILLSESSSQNLETGSSDENLVSTTDPKEDSEEWTPLQLEQIELAKNLNDYISSFQKKILGLSVKLSDRELIVLFIMYLHPRWRRFVEPMELSFSQWIEAAAYAKLHCGRVSAMLGCEKEGPGCIFNTPESRALRDSGYFSPDTPVTELNEEKDKLVNNINVNQDNLIDDSKSDSATTSSVNSTNKRQQQEEDEDEEEEKEPLKQDILKVNTTEEDTTTQYDTNNHNNNDVEFDKPNTVDTHISVPNKKSNQKKKKKVEEQQPQQLVDATDLIIYNIPPEQKGINLTFLELPIKDKKVKALIAKLRWTGSAISVDCAKSLGLEIDENDSFGLQTEFGYVDAIGDLILPFYHPEDKTKRKWEIRVLVLPKIYGGKVNLVLGADFFFIYQPILNIKSRTIYFLGKETPYIVDQLH